MATPDNWKKVEIEEPFEKSFDLQMEHFLECVAGRAKPKVTAAEAANLLKTLLKLYENNKH